jgi:hypothetical protein
MLCASGPRSSGVRSSGRRIEQMFDSGESVLRLAVGHRLVLAGAADKTLITEPDFVGTLSTVPALGIHIRSTNHEYILAHLRGKHKTS